MALELDAVVFDVADAMSAATFWAGMLERSVRLEPGGASVPGDATQVGLRFVTSRTEQAGPRHLHLLLTSSSAEDQQAIVERALELGGRHLDVGQGPEEPFVVLADPQGNELCIIEPGNAYLAGTGTLGEVTCDGAPAVGRFWRDALGWPLVLDEQGQTAVQSPLGGTKISWDSWEEDPPRPAHRRNRQRFDLICTEPEIEVERLLALGATRREDQDGHLELADPGGHEFGLRRSSSTTR